MNTIGDLQMQVNVLFFAVTFLVVLAVITLRLAFRTARQWRHITEQLTQRITLLEEQLTSTKGNE